MLGVQLIAPKWGCNNSPTRIDIEDAEEFELP